MITGIDATQLPGRIFLRADALFRQHLQNIYVHTDRMFAVLMVLQWLGAMAAALLFSPHTWIGAVSSPHIHVWAAVVLGGIITVLPVWFAITRPGATLTRHCIAAGQLFMSGLLIHVTGGRIETHFHVFGSLAFLAFYRDWRVLVTATLVTATDHIVRGIYWPLSIYGVQAADGLRWIEHVGWVLFEDVFLLISCTASLRDMYEVCERDARLETSNAELELKVAERTREVEHLAYHDALTNLPNRLLFLDRLARALIRARHEQLNLAVLYIDLDNFKRINDTKGHQAGDALLKEVTARMSSCIRAGDTLARMGGDEFIILLDEVADSDDVRTITERILKALAAPIQLADGYIYVGASIGISYAAAGDHTDVLIQRADTAMYHAKVMGKGTYAFFSPQMNDSAQERLSIETGLRSALERNEMRVYYQPLLNVATGKLSGVEALARWQHSELGLVPPSKFITIAEEAGIIAPIGYWIMEQACAQMKRWIDADPEFNELMINVNLSGRQLLQADVVEKISAILQKVGLPAQNLKLEITESVFLGDIKEVVGKLHELKAMGIKLAIDDFGTGYSSMSALDTFPVDTVKIDRTFINRLGDEGGVAMVSAIITLSKAMNLTVTSEGVETEEQLTLLQTLGCDTVQGYLLGNPMSGDEFDERLQRRGAGLSAQLAFCDR